MSKPWIHVHVLSNTEFSDSSNGGVTSPENRKDTVFLLLDSRFPGDYDEERILRIKKRGKNVVELETRTRNGHAFAVVRNGRKGEMMGGNFVWSSDSRFREFFPYPIPVHDRHEYG